jgi:hypothetical protein
VFFRLLEGLSELSFKADVTCRAEPAAGAPENGRSGSSERPGSARVGAHVTHLRCVVVEGTTGTDKASAGRWLV